MIYNEHVSQPWFTYISDGTKTVEGRRNKGRFKEMKVGDVVVWFNEQTSVKTVITEKNVYLTFREYLTKEGLDKCLPGISTIEKGVKVYYQYYTPEDEKKYGVVAIRIKLI